jgi:hypothetical protein
MVKGAAETETKDVHAGSIIEAIREGRWKERVEAIREEYVKVLLATGDREQAKRAIGSLKKKLPAFTPSGRFSYRNDKSLIEHSGMVCADIDKLGDELQRVWERLKTSPSLFWMFLSPSGDGIKAVFLVPPADAATHKRNRYEAVKAHVLKITGGGPWEYDDTPDVARLCFVSYDAQSYVNDGAVEIPPLPEPAEPEKPKNGATPPPAADPDGRRRIVAEIVGEIREADGKLFCDCPGKHRHTQGDGPKDCEIFLNGSPTLHCVHNSCAGILAGANHELRSRIGKAETPGSVSVREARPVELQPVEPYTPPPLALLPGVLREYVDAAAESLNVDRAFIMLPLLSALASAIGNSRSILVKRGFTQPPVLWTGPIGRSGQRKSPAIDTGTFPTREREKFLIRCASEHEQEFQKKLTEWEAGAKPERGPKPEPPTRQTALMDDMTLASLADAMQNNPRGVLVCKDELSQWFTSFDQFTDKKGCELPRWLTLHSGFFFGLDRRDDGKRGRSYRIFNPRVCITGGIQPAVLARCLTQDYFERGLPARFLFAMPPFRRDRWTDAVIPEALTQAVRDLFALLYALDPERDGDEIRPAPLPLDDDAKDVYVQFYNQCGELAEQENERGEAAWSKATGTAARLALVGMLANDPMTVTVTGGIMQAAVELAGWAGHEATRIYQTLGEKPEQSEARRLVEFIQRRGGAVSVRDLTHGIRAYRNQTETAEAALTRLAISHLGQWDSIPPSPNGGPPTRLFRLLSIPDSTGVTVTRTPENTRKLRGYGDGDTEYAGENEATMEEEAALL